MTDQVTVTQEMLESTRLISMSEAAYWTAIQAAEQRGMERAAAIAEEIGAGWFDERTYTAQHIAQTIRQAAKDQA